MLHQFNFFSRNDLSETLWCRGNANEIKAKFIIEGANHPTDPEADEVREIRFFAFTLLLLLLLLKLSVTKDYALSISADLEEERCCDPTRYIRKLRRSHRKLLRVGSGTTFEPRM